MKNSLKITATLLISFLLLSCGTNNPKSSIPDTVSTKKVYKLKAVAINIPDVQILINVAKKLDIFKKNSLDVEIISVDKGTDAMLMSNSVDVKIGALSNAMSMYLNNQNPLVIKTLYGTTYTSAIVTRYSKSELSKITKVAVAHIGNDGHYMLLAGLKNLGVDINKLEIVAIPDDLVKLNLMRKGEIDAISTSNYEIIDKDKNFSYYPMSNNETLKGYKFPKSIIVNKKVYVGEKKIALDNFEKSIIETVDYMTKNKEDTVSIIEKTLQVSKEKGELIYSNFLESLNKDNGTTLSQDLENTKKLIISINKVDNPNRSLIGFLK